MCLLDCLETQVYGLQFQAVFLGFCCLCSVVQSCLTLCSPMNCSPLGSSVHGILQARILEWVVVPPPGDLLNPGVTPTSPALQADFLPLSHHLSVGKQTEKQFVYLSQQLGRTTYPERKDMGVLSKEEG